MAHVLVLKAANPAGERSPEMRYLLSDLLLQVRRAFGAATLVVVGGEGSGEDEGRAGGTAAVARHLEAGDFSHALLLSPGDTLLRQPSLQRMARAADSDGEEEAAGEVVAAVARRLAATGLANASNAYTLSDFERLEATFLANDDLPRALRTRHLEDLWPATLVTAAGLRHLLATYPPEALVGCPGVEGKAPMPEGVTATYAGLCHEFIDYYGEVRSDVAPFLPEGAVEVLEVGCGRGATGRFLQDELGCRVTGVELNPVVGREAARHLHRVVVGNVEEPATLAELGSGGDGEAGAGFDALLALELFEHLVDPESFLDRVRPLVRPGGRIILSVPNVGHHSVVRDLLAGRWDYLPIGILCYTHYRFYTRRTLEDWLARCGFPDARVVAQRTPPPAWLAAAGGEGAADGGRGTGADLGLPLDTESLTTQGFYVLLDV